MDGESVDVQETFSNGLDYPGDPSGDAAETAGCTCTVDVEVTGPAEGDGYGGDGEGDTTEGDTTEGDGTSLTDDIQAVEDTLPENPPVLEFDGQLGIDERMSLNGYTSPGGNRAFNDDLRAGHSSGSHIEDLDSAISKSHTKNDSTLYRGISVASDRKSTRL